MLQYSPDTRNYRDMRWFSITPNSRLPAIEIQVHTPYLYCATTGQSRLFCSRHIEQITIHNMFSQRLFRRCHGELSQVQLYQLQQFIRIIWLPMVRLTPLVGSSSSHYCLCTKAFHYSEPSRCLTGMPVQLAVESWRFSQGFRFQSE